MTATDIFIGVIIIGTVIAGLITVFLGYADYYVIGTIQNFNKGLPPSVNPGAATTSLLNFSSSFATFFPDLSVVLAIVLMAETWMLSAFIKSHPLAAVVGVVSLFAYTIAAFFISNAMIGAVRGVANAIPSFASYLSFAGPIIQFWIYLPIIGVVATIIDISIAVVAARA